MLGGGPVGALIGALAGHFLIDREMPQLSPGEAPGVVFTIAMIALAAKMAKADGTVTDERGRDLPPPVPRAKPREGVGRPHLPPGAAGHRRLRGLCLADRPDAGRQSRFAGRHSRRPVRDRQGRRRLPSGEAAFLERVADIFGFTQNEYRRIRAAHIGPDKGDPYVILGVAFDADDARSRRPTGCWCARIIRTS
ncbi:MAG: hypothetical protein WDN08_18460 [Rhizomicrobium sp.]